MDLVSMQAGTFAPGIFGAAAPALDWLELAHGLVDEGVNLMVMEWDGDSLSDSIVSGGALVVLRPDRTAHDGEMVAVRTKSTQRMTLEYYHRDNGYVWLQSANPSRRSRKLQATEVEVQGQVVMILRPAAASARWQPPAGFCAPWELAITLPCAEPC